MIKQISIKGLFGIHDYVIDLENNITIIHGVNGCGKTTILRMVNYIFERNFEKLLEIEFEKIKLVFSDAAELDIERKPFYSSEKRGRSAIAKSTRFYYFELRLTTKGESFKSPSDDLVKKLDNKLPLDVLQAFLQRKATADNSILNNKREHIYTLWNDDVERVYYNFTRYFNTEWEKITQEEEEIYKRLEPIRTKFITTDRLKCDREVELSEDVKDKSSDSRVAENANEIARKIRTTLQDYGDISQRIDRALPFKVIKEPKHLPVDDIVRKLFELEDQRNRYIEIGILEPEKEVLSLHALAPFIEGGTQQLLSQYVEDCEQKLSVFTDLSDKIRLLKKMLEQKFTDKNVIFDKESGLSFTLKQTGKKLLGMQLSSGEQQEIIMLYDLIFNTSPDILILIDEPELSLHVKWQLEFIDNLLEIIGVNKFSSIIATHSPEIIDDRWDLTQSLKSK